MPMYERNGVRVDTWTEDGSEGTPGADLPRDAAGDDDVPASEIEAAVLAHVARADGGSDFVRWPRHFLGPRRAALIVRARQRLAARGAIVFHDHYWRLVDG